MQTYWLHLTAGKSSESNASSLEHSNRNLRMNAIEVESNASRRSSAALKPVVDKMATDKIERLIGWNVDVLVRLLKQIVSRRRAEQATGTREEPSISESSEHRQAGGSTTIDEVKEIIFLPKFNAKAAANQESPEQIQLPRAVIDQLYDYVVNMAGW